MSGIKEFLPLIIVSIALLPALVSLIVRHAKQRREDRLNEEPYRTQRLDSKSIKHLVRILSDETLEHDRGVLKDTLIEIIDRNRGNDVGIQGTQELIRLLANGTLPIESISLLQKGGDALARRTVNADFDIQMAILFGCHMEREAAKKIFDWYLGKIDFQELTKTAEPKLPTAA